MNNISCLRCSIKGNIALQCSLVLSGIKPSNLLIYQNRIIDTERRIKK